MRPEGNYYYDKHREIVKYFTALRNGISEFNGNSNDYYIYISCILAASSDALRGAALQPVGAAYRIECNLSCSSIASMTALPRETVRRHLHRLTQTNLLKASESGGYCISLELSDISKYIPIMQVEA